jgi:hypothetical protein
MREAGDEGREVQVTADANRHRVRDAICGSDAQLAELIRSPAIRLAAAGQRAGVIRTRSDRHETQSLDRHHAT